MKKAIIIFLCFGVCVTAFGQVLTHGDFQYTTSNNTVTITKYTGRGGAVNIPAAIERSLDEAVKRKTTAALRGGFLVL